MLQIRQKGNWILLHDRYIDKMGFEVDDFELLYRNQNKNTHFPFIGKIKPHNKNKDFPINRIPYEYTENDYEEMLEEEIVKISRYEMDSKKV